jgi:hypothetical protein
MLPLWVPIYRLTLYVEVRSPEGEDAVEALGRGGRLGSLDIGEGAPFLEIASRLAKI